MELLQRRAYRAELRVIHGLEASGRGIGVRVLDARDARRRRDDAGVDLGDLGLRIKPAMRHTKHMKHTKNQQQTANACLVKLETLNKPYYCKK